MLRTVIYFVGFLFMLNQLNSSEKLKIVTLNSPNKNVLSRKTEEIKSGEFPLAKQIADKLINALKPYSPAAGLAAPQIGISKAVFIYSFDRDPKNLEVVINPQFKPLDLDTKKGWEGCLSVITDKDWRLAYLPHYETIEVTYFNLEGTLVKKRLSGFAAKVFQHEFDHLQGIACVNHQEANVKTFASKQELMDFMQQVKKDDATHYKKPVNEESSTH